MAYYQDLSEYSYCSDESWPGTKNVGWLEKGHEFDKATQPEHILDLLWNVCTISVVQMRGLHYCDLCQPPALVSAERKGLSLSLGSSEIRVFSRQGEVYAAPTLIYHYVKTHQYKPPDEFLLALQNGPKPPGAEYFAELRKIGFEYGTTHKHDPAARARGCVKQPDGSIALQELEIPRFHDTDR